MVCVPKGVRGACTRVWCVRMRARYVDAHVLVVWMQVYLWCVCDMCTRVMRVRERVVCACTVIVHRSIDDMSS